MSNKLSFTYPSTNFTFNVRLNSWVNFFTGTDGVTLGRTIYFKRGYRPTVRLLTHELCHINQIHRLGLVNFLWQYITSSSKRRAFEKEAWDYSAEHLTSAFEMRVVKVLNDIQ
jgi:hypothetical protein